MADQCKAPSEGGVSFTDTNAETGAQGSKRDADSNMGDVNKKNGGNDDENEKKNELDKLNNDGDESGKDDKKNKKKRKGKKKKKRKTAHFKKRGNPTFKVMALTFGVLSLISFVTSMALFGLLIYDVMTEEK